MLKNKTSLNNAILKYFLLFSLIILGLLWFLQFIFFNSFYRKQKTNDIQYVADKIKNERDYNNFFKKINDLSFDKSVCIEVINSNYDLVYSSNYFGKGCISSGSKTAYFKFDFINSNVLEKNYEIRNPNFNNDTLIKGIRHNNGSYIFINTSLEPVDSMVFLIRKQLIIISIVVLSLSFVIAYFISNYIARPIKNISLLSKGLVDKKDYSFETSNISEIDDLAMSIKYAKDELDKTDELRRDLMANVSHDLKTPLTMIKAYAEMASDIHLNKKDAQISDMKTIISEVDRLNILVSDILELSKMESNVIDLSFSNFDLVDLINNIISKYNVLVETEKYNFIFNHKSDEIVVNADKKRIEQVIYNLVNNAINYTGDDNTVTINVIEEDSILVEIVDTGKGIKSDDLPYIWDKYYKNKKRHKRSLVGTGLGLSIVKKILEEHKFKYGVNSSSKGTTFYFYINK